MNARIPLTLASLALALSVACSGGTAAPTQQPAATAAATAQAAPDTPAQPTAAATTAPARQGGTVDLNALYFSQGRDGKVEGGTSVFKVTVAPKSEPGIRVSFSESEVGGQGDSIRAAGWTAAVMSSLLLGIDPGKLSFTYDISGRVDGPSAGALMTIGTLAAILGDEVSKDFAMTGTINPDGSIGPVGGIPHKIDGAAAAGIKTVLVPSGQRTDYDLELGQAVDLIRRGEDKGVTVRLVSNIFEAYEAATGKPLPVAKGTGRPELPSQVFDKTRAQAVAWLARYSEHRNRFQSLDPDIQDFYASDMAMADEYAALAQRSLNEGAVSVGLERAIAAVQFALPANRQAQLFQTYLDRDLQAALAQADASVNVSDAVKALFERLRAEQPKTASDSIGLMDAYSNAVVAQAYMAKGDAEVNALLRNAAQLSEDEILYSLFLLSNHYSNAEIFVEITKTNLDLLIGSGTSPAPSVDTLVGLAEMLRRAAEANLAAFDAVVIRAIAQNQNVRDEVVKAGLAELDGSYEIALFSTSSLGIDQQQSGANRLQQTYYTLGGALNAYALTTQLISKYYSLGAEVDSNFNVVGYQRETALQNMLQLAERRAEEQLALTKDVSLSSLYYYTNARVYRDGDAQQKLSALFYYWQASILSNVMANMTGEYGEQIRSDLRSTNRSVDFHAANSFKP